SDMYDYLISPSAFCTEKFTSAFGLEDRQEIIQEVGYPRNDDLFTFDDVKVTAIKYNLGVPQDKKVILYAPTWRDNQHIAGTGYVYKNEMDLDLMKERFGDEYVILYRTHYFVAKQLDLSKYQGFVYNVSNYDDINDLYIISDILITDYSSVFFDYADLRRPILFYMYDLNDYQTNIRDFYIDLSELPGPIAQTQEELINEIENIDQFDEKYHDVYKAFNDKFNYLDDGHAAARVVDCCILNEK
ncbi:MAG: CDP-glycerol glycerophosphotransferase family protein, partial [Erysipelotrichaceae bacterium]|nr:CDP-glycerol glycerophosphotransferase family protein [Erysipelotrichaceae bacterium]